MTNKVLWQEFKTYKVPLTELLSKNNSGLKAVKYFRKEIIIDVS